MKTVLVFGAYHFAAAIRVLQETMHLLEFDCFDRKCRE